jgi:threonine/homoserine/homoserine lactone efflux protein
MWGNLLAFSAAVLIGGLVPGPTMVIMIRQTLRSGRTTACWALLGNEVGVLAWGVAAAFGLSGIVEASPTAYDVLRWVGAGVLILIGVQSLRHAGESGIDLDGPPDRSAEASRWAPFRLGLVTVVSNPKYGLFALSFLPQFVPADAPVRTMTLLLSAVWVVLDASLYCTIIFCVAKIRRLLVREAVRRTLEQVAGLVLVGLGIRLLLGGL